MNTELRANKREKGKDHNILRDQKMKAIDREKVAFIRPVLLAGGRFTIATRSKRQAEMGTWGEGRKV